MLKHRKVKGDEMKKKILSCLLAMIMLSGFVALPSFAESEVLGIVATEVGPTAVWRGDLPGPSTDYWYYFYNNDLNTVPWIEYEVVAPSTGSYHVDYAAGGTTSMKILVNGSEASQKTGSTAGDVYQTTRKWATWQSCEMPVPLYEGKNTIRVELIPGNYLNKYWHAGFAAAKFTKISDTPVLGTTTKAMAGATSNYSKISFPSDPWIWLNISDFEDSLNIKFNVDFPKTGYYKARVGAKANSVATISVGDQTATMNNMIKLDTYCLSGSLGTKAPWFESEDVLYIEKGIHEVTYQMNPDAKINEQYQIKVAGFQFANVDDMTQSQSGNFKINPVYPSRVNASSGEITVSNNDIYIPADKSTEYDVYVTEDASYYVNYNGTDATYTQITVNGETVNFRTGRTKNADGSCTFRDEVQLKEGKNTVKLSTVGAHSAKLSELSFTKLPKKQYTISMNSSNGGRQFTQAYKSDLGVDPWLWISDKVEDYPIDNPPYVTLPITVPKDGYYFPMVAISGSNNIKLSINGKDFAINDNCTISSEPYVAGATDTAACTWLESNDGIFLQAGIYDITLSLYNVKSDSWNTSIGAVRLVEGEQPVINNDSFAIDITSPNKNNGAIISDNSVVLAPNQSVDYNVYIAEDASYYVNFTRANAEENKSFYIAVTANGETINRRTGRIQNADGSYTFCDEIQLKAGKNTINVATMGNNSGILSSLSFTKLGAKQYTIPMNSAQGGRKFKQAYKANLGVDPWLWINDSVADYPDGNTSPYFTVELTIPESGNYYPAIAAKGDDGMVMNISDYTISFEDSTVLPDIFQSSGNADATANLIRSNDYIYLEKGTYDVKILLKNPANKNWNTFIGAIRFIEYTPYELAITGTSIDENGVVTVDYISPEDTDFYIIAASYTDNKLNKADVAFVPAVNAPGRVILNVGTGQNCKLFVWESLSNATPLIPETDLR